MSLFGFDILHLPLSRYYSGDESTAVSSHHGASEQHQETVEPISDDVADDVTSPPLQWIELDQNSLSSAPMEDEDGWEGITIMSSVPSSQVNSLSASTRPVEILALSPAVASSQQQSPFSQMTFAANRNPLSISTSESMFADRNIWDGQSLTLSRSFSLSSSLAELSLHSSPTTTSLVTVGDSTRRSNANASVLSIPLQQQVVSRQTPGQQQQYVWYARFNSERDWEEFKTQALELLAALDEPIEHPDQILAILIQQEEALFWEDPALRQQREQAMRTKRCYKWGALVMGEVALMLTSAGLARRSG